MHKDLEANNKLWDYSPRTVRFEVKAVLTWATMVRFSLRRLTVITAAVAVASSIFIALRPRDLRSEIAAIAKTSKTFNSHEVVGDFSMLQETLQLSLDGTYCFTIYGCFGVSFVETGSWSLNRNLIDFTVNPSSMNSGRPMRWAYATIENDRLIIIPDYFADWYIDRADMSLSFSRTIVPTEVEAREQSDRPQATDLPL